MDLGIGSALRDQRRRIGCTLADAAAETRVRESYLAALEQEEFAGLGGDVYVRGFLSSYARYLQLDPQPLIDAYRAGVQPAPESRLAPRAPVGTMPGSEPVDGPRANGPLVVGAVAVAVLVLLVVLFLRGDGDATAALWLTGLPA
jgi:cytoskeleton protein RodZ